MKNLFISFALFWVGISVYAKPVDEATAKKTGLNFLVNNTAHAFQSSTDLKLAYKSEANQTVYYYVFNADHGFVMVSGDDQAIPILGYSDEGIFSPNNMPIQVSEWLNGYNSQMKYIIENNIAATPEISAKWSNLINNISPTAPQQTNTGGATLLTTSWDQLPYYNDQCPYDAATKRHTATGCVATAMAQLMKFWNYPATGTGFHSYSDPFYGTQSASFGGTTYQWTNMPDKINSTNTAIATLMYQCGVSVNMTYSPSESDAYVLSSQSPQKNCAEYALKTYFGYDRSLHGIIRSGYASDAAWIDTIEAEINAGRPVIYTGTGNGGGHCFICDGYNGNNLHFNWGWGGIYNGYFSINALNPGTGGTGSGSGSYNSNEQAIIGIQPSKALLSYNIGLNTALTLSADSVLYQNNFNLYSAFININSNSHNFTGDFCAEIFDSANNIADSFIISTSSTLNMGQNTGAVAVTIPGQASLLPGKYTVQVFYRPTGGSWTIIVDNGYKNSVPLKVYWTNTLELAAPIITTPELLQQGKSITVKTNVVNTGSSQFDGYFYAYLYNLNGNPDLFIEKVSGSLKPDSSFANGITFTNSNDTVSPGTYLLVIYYTTGSGPPYNLLGSTYYQNPLKINVATPSLPPDQYEPDNTVDSSYDMSPNFAMDSADIQTVSANINTGSDVDYYKVVVPSGYFYTFSGNLYDTRYPSVNQNYTLDGVFSFTEDGGKNWSGTFDKSIPGTAIVNGPDTVVFKVAPIFPGATGTYQLDLKVKRSAGAAIKPVVEDDNNIKIFPNPAQNILNIDYSNLHAHVQQIILTDITGKRVLTISNPESNMTLQIPVQYLQSGIYAVQIQTENGLITRQISITK